MVLITAIELEGFMMQQYFLITICHLQHPLSIAAIWVKQRRFTGIDEVKLSPALCALIAHLAERRHCSVQPDPAGSGCPGARSRPPAVFYPGEAAPGRFLYSVQRTAGVKHRGFHGLGHTPASFVPRLPVRVSMRMAMRSVHLKNRDAGPAILPQPSGALPDIGFGNPAADCSIGGFTPATGQVCWLCRCLGRSAEPACIERRLRADG